MKIVNISDYVQHEITMKIGLNCRIQSITHVEKTTHVKLKAIIPYELKLLNGALLEGFIVIPEVGYFTFKKTRTESFILEKGVDLKAMDKIINQKIEEFNKNAVVESIKWSGAKETMIGKPLLTEVTQK